MLLTIVALLACQSPGGSDDSGGASSGKSDADGDGYAGSADCDDGDPSVHPDQADPCDGADSDCDGQVDEDVDLAWYADADGDGWGAVDASPTSACSQPAGTVSNHRDCDDADPAVWPGQTEACDGVDNDCDGAADEDLGEPVTVYPDEDGDGAGDADAAPITTCAGLATGADNQDDCDDTDPSEPVYVDADGRRAGTGTMDDPMASIQDGIDAAQQCVRVAPGFYVENLDTDGRSLDVRSTGSSADTEVMSASGESILTVIAGESPTFAGFRFSGGSGRQNSSSYRDGSGNTYYTYSSYGGAIYVYLSNLTLEDVDIEGNSVWRTQSSSVYDSGSGTYITTTYDGYGGGIYARSADLTLTDVRVATNDGGVGAGIYTEYSYLDAIRTSLEGNLGSTFAGLYAVYGEVTLRNVLFNVNEDDYEYGALSCSGCELLVENGTFVDNTTAVLQYNDASVYLDSVTIQGGKYGLAWYDGSFDAWYTNFYNLTGANINGTEDISDINGNTSVSSGFKSFNNDADPTNDDLHLSGSSSLQDAGNPGAAHNDADGSRNQVGAYGGPDGAAW